MWKLFKDETPQENKQILVYCLIEDRYETVVIDDGNYYAGTRRHDEPWRVDYTQYDKWMYIPD